MSVDGAMPHVTQPESEPLDEVEDDDVNDYLEDIVEGGM